MENSDSQRVWQQAGVGHVFGKSIYCKNQPPHYSQSNNSWRRLAKNGLSRKMTNREWPNPGRQGCWRNEGSIYRGVDRGRGLGLDEFFFSWIDSFLELDEVISNVANTPTRSRRVVFQKLSRSLDQVRGLYSRVQWFWLFFHILRYNNPSLTP